MVVSDFDGTLMNYPNQFDDKQLKVLSDLKNKGIKFCIVTGRSVSFFYQFPLLLNIIDYIISSNGGNIYDVKNKKFLLSICINNKSLDKLIKLGISNNNTFIINELDKIYKYGNLKNIDSYKFKIEKQYNSEQMIFYVNNNDIDEFKDTIKNIEDIVINNINYKKEIYSIDINDKNVSKGNSVLWLCDYLDIDSKEVIAFGDGENDISMFKVIENSVCVENACLELKKYANDIAIR